MTDKLPKLATVELDDDLRIVLARVCEDLHLEPGIAIIYIRPLMNRWTS